MSNFFNSRPATSEARTYVTINGTDMRTYGLELTDYKIGAPVPVTHYIDVPGRHGRIDASDILNGYITYSHREIELTFHIRQTYAEWHSFISVLSAAVDGVESRVIFSKDPDWYYKGRFMIDFSKSNPVSGDVVLKCENAFPFKLKYTEVTIENIAHGSLINEFFDVSDSVYVSELNIDIETVTATSGTVWNVSADLASDTSGHISSQSLSSAKPGLYYMYLGDGDIAQSDDMIIHAGAYSADYVFNLHLSFEQGGF